MIPVLAVSAGELDFRITANSPFLTTSSSDGTVGTSTVVKVGGADPVTYSIAAVDPLGLIMATSSGATGSVTLTYNLPSPGLYSQGFRWTAVDNLSRTVTHDIVATVVYFT